MAMSFGLENISNSIVTNADKINNLITGIFYPIKLYLNLINKLNAIDIIKLIFLLYCKHDIRIIIIPIYLKELLAPPVLAINTINIPKIKNTSVMLYILGIYKKSFFVILYIILEDITINDPIQQIVAINNNILLASKFRL